MVTWCNHLGERVTGLLGEILPLALSELQSGGVEVPIDARPLDLSGPLTSKGGRQRAWSASIYWRTSRSFVVKLRKTAAQRDSAISIEEEMHYRAATEPMRRPGDEAEIIGEWIAGLGRRFHRARRTDWMRRASSRRRRSRSTRAGSGCTTTRVAASSGRC